MLDAADVVVKRELRGFSISVEPPPSTGGNWRKLLENCHVRWTSTSWWWLVGWRSLNRQFTSTSGSFLLIREEHWLNFTFRYITKSRRIGCVIPRCSPLLNWQFSHQSTQQKKVIAMTSTTRECKQQADFTTPFVFTLTAIKSASSGDFLPLFLPLMMDIAL